MGRRAIFQTNNPPGGFGVLFGIEGKMIEVDQKAGKVF